MLDPSVGSLPPTAPASAPANDGGGQDTARLASASAYAADGFCGATSARDVTDPGPEGNPGGNAAPSGRPRVGKVTSPKRHKSDPTWHLDFARRVSAGASITAAARACNRSRQAASRLASSPAWPGLLARAEDAARRAAERDAALARPAAVARLRAIVDAADGVTPADAVRAATALLGVSDGPTDRQRDAARRWLLGHLTPSTRSLVVRELDGHGVDLSALDDGELAALDVEAARILGREVRS